MISDTDVAGPAVELTGRNYATDQVGGIHDDAAAAKYGYVGGLVPGVALFTAAIPRIVESYGDAWAARGRVELRFRRPCYDGDVLRMVGPQACPDGRIRFDLSHEGGASSCEIHLSPDAGEPPALTDYPETASKADWGSVADFLLDLEHMGSVSQVATADDIAEYVGAVGGSDPFSGTDRVNPGYLLRTYIHLSRAVFPTKPAGPTIHVASTARYFAPVPVGSTLSIRGRVKHLYAKNGNRYVMYDYAWFLSDGTPVLQDDHTVVYELKQHRQNRGNSDRARA